MVTKNRSLKGYFAGGQGSPRERWHSPGGRGLALGWIQDKRIEKKCKDYNLVFWGKIIYKARNLNISKANLTNF